MMVGTMLSSRFKRYALMDVRDGGAGPRPDPQCYLSSQTVSQCTSNSALYVYPFTYGWATM